MIGTLLPSWYSKVVRTVLVDAVRLAKDLRMFVFPPFRCAIAQYVSQSANCRLLSGKITSLRDNQHAGACNPYAKGKCA